MINLDFSILVTILYVAILYLFMKKMFFQPIMNVLHTRKTLTAGRLEEAQKAMQQVENKVAGYEQTLKKARGEIYREQELRREAAVAQKAELVAKARKEAEALVHEGRTRLTTQAQVAKKNLESEVDILARKLTATILKN
jgi:F-type H+-transporting ATPase subunit b